MKSDERRFKFYLSYEVVSQLGFETRHSPHFSQLRKLMINGLVSQ